MASLNKNVRKEKDPYKPKVEYHFGTSNDPDRYLTMKTKRKIDRITTDKDLLS